MSVESPQIILGRGFAPTITSYLATDDGRDLAELLAEVDRESHGRIDGDTLVCLTGQWDQIVTTHHPETCPSYGPLFTVTSDAAAAVEVWMDGNYGHEGILQGYEVGAYISTAPVGDPPNSHRADTLRVCCNDDLRGIDFGESSAPAEIWTAMTDAVLATLNAHIRVQSRGWARLLA